MEGEKKADWFHPDYPPLKGDVGTAAVNGQLKSYPKVVRTNADPPVSGQNLGCVSYMLFKEPQKTKSGKTVVGFFKLRGNWVDKSQAENHSVKIIREVDSKFPIKIAPIGLWVPITEDSDLEQEVREVNTGPDGELEDKALQEKRDEQKRIMREVKEREEQFKNEGDIYDDPLSLDFYAMKRVTNNRLNEMLEIKRRNLESLEQKAVITRKILKRIEQEKPEYKDQWIDRYNEKRHEGGIPDYRPSEKEFEEYEESMKSIKLEEEYLNLDAKEAVERMNREGTKLAKYE